MICWGLNTGWTQWVLGIPFHDQWMQPPLPVKAIPGLLDGPANMGWFGGDGVTHKKGAKTTFDGHPAVQHTHDVGYLIPHFAIPPNLGMVMNMAVSKHKVMFPVSRVIIEKKPMGSYFFMFLGLICSQPVSLPTGLAIPFAGTVMSSMTKGDIVLGFCFIAVDMTIDLIWTKIFKGSGWVGRKSHIKSVLDRVFSEGAIKAAAQGASSLSGKATSWFLVRGVTQKWMDHLAKSWGLSPLMAGAIFQTAQPLTGLERKQLPSISIGRAGANIRFFPFPVKARENVFN